MMCLTLLYAYVCASSVDAPRFHSDVKTTSGRQLFLTLLSLQPARVRTAQLRSTAASCLICLHLSAASPNNQVWGGIQEEIFGCRCQSSCISSLFESKGFVHLQNRETGDTL